MFNDDAVQKYSLDGWFKFGRYGARWFWNVFTIGSFIFLRATNNLKKEMKKIIPQLGTTIFAQFVMYNQCWLFYKNMNFTVFTANAF